METETLGLDMSVACCSALVRGACTLGCAVSPPGDGITVPFRLAGEPGTAGIRKPHVTAALETRVPSLLGGLRGSSGREGREQGGPAEPSPLPL